MDDRARNTHCAAGAACNQGSATCVHEGSTCYDEWTIRMTNGGLEVCTPYRCKAGKCWEVYLTDTDCATGYKCVNSCTYWHK